MKECFLSSPKLLQQLIFGLYPTSTNKKYQFATFFLEVPHIWYGPDWVGKDLFLDAAQDKGQGGEQLLQGRVQGGVSSIHCLLSSELVRWRGQVT